MEPIDFLKEYGGIQSETDNITYRPYEYGTLVYNISVKDALVMIERDIKEMADLFSSFDLTYKQAVDGVYKIWKKQLVVFSLKKEK